MKQLNIFIQKLQDTGISVLTMWESKLEHGGIVRTCTISKGKRTIDIMFLVYEGDKGFGVFSCVPGVEMSKSVEFLQDLLG